MSNDRELLRRLLLVTGARIACLGLWLLVLVAIYKRLGQLPDGLAEAGAFAFALALIKVCTGWVGGPTDLEVMRRVPTALARNRAKGGELWRVALLLRLGAGLVLFVAIVAAAGPLAGWFLQSEVHRSVVLAAGVAIISELCFRGTAIYFQAVEDFPRFVLLEAVLQIARAAILLSALYLAAARADMLVLAYAASFVVATVVGVAMLPQSAVNPFRVTTVEVRAALSYVKWLLLAGSLAALNERMDLFLLSLIKGPVQAGLYGAALSIALIPDAVQAFMVGVLQPRVVTAYESRRFWPLLTWYLRIFVPLGIVGGVLVWLCADRVIGLLLGPAYQSVTSVFVVLAWGAILWLMLTPLPASLIALTRPRTLLALSAMQSLLLLAVGGVAIPRYGALGAASTIAIMRCIIAVLTMAIAWRMVMRLDLLVQPEGPSRERAC